MLTLALKNATIIVLFLAINSFSHLRPTDENHGVNKDIAPVVIQVEKTTRGIAYKVDSKPTGSTPTTDLLYVLNKVNDRRGSNTPVVVLLDSRVPIDQIWNVDGTAGKAQLTNLHFFVIDHDTEKMVEVRWGPAIPISRNPPLE